MQVPHLTMPYFLGSCQNIRNHRLSCKCCIFAGQFIVFEYLLVIVLFDCTKRCSLVGMLYTRFVAWPQLRPSRFRAALGTAFDHSKFRPWRLLPLFYVCAAYSEPVLWAAKLIELSYLFYMLSAH